MLFVKVMLEFLILIITASIILQVEQCAEKSVRPVTRISGHVNVTENSLSALKVRNFL